MKKLLLILLTSPLLLTANASNPLTVGDFNLQLDTVCHNKIGPGATRTQLHLAGAHPLDVHYITVDLSAPGVKLKAAHGASVNGLEKTSAMAARLSSHSNRYFAGINGDFFDVTTTYPDGSSRPRLSTYTQIIDGDIRKTSPRGHQFIVDNNGIPYIDLLDFSKSTLCCGSATVALGGVNVENINYTGDSAADNAVTIYTSEGWKSTFQTQYAGKCAEVTARLASGDTFSSSTSCKFEITSETSSEGNMVIPSGGFVLFGRGVGKEFIESLKPGDIVSLNHKITLSGGDALIPMQCIGGNPPTVIGGIAQPSDGTRPDAVEFHPRTGIGISRDGKTVIMMVVDGRGKSFGATTKMLGDLLVYAGAWRGLNFDGGGSSTCWTASHGVINTCSDSSGERTVQNSLFAVVEGDTENRDIAEIHFADWKKSLYSNENYTPAIYGYNKSGLLIDTNLKDFSLSCTPGMGEISADGGTFTATGATGGYLTANYNNLSATIPVEIIQTSESSLADDFQFWSQSANQLKVTSVSSTATGGKIEYQMGNSVSSARLALGAQKRFEKDCIALTMNFSTLKPLKKIQASLKAANADAVVTVEKNDCGITGNEWTISLKDHFDLSDPSVWPIQFTLLTLYPSEAAKGTGNIEFTKISSVNLANSGVTEIPFSEVPDNDEEEWWNLIGDKVNPCNLTPGVYIRRKEGKSKKILIR